MRAQPSLTLTAVALLGACSPATVVVGDAESSSTSTDPPSSDTSTTESGPEPLRFATVAIAAERVCAITAPDRRVVCRDMARCDGGRDPAEWDLDDPTCWLAAGLPDTEYSKLALRPGGLCALRADDGAIECDGDYVVPEGSGYVDLETTYFGLCATDGAVLHCLLAEAADTVPAVSSLDGNLALSTVGISDVLDALIGCVDPGCLVLQGTFVEVFGTFEQGSNSRSGCGLRIDGTVACSLDIEPIADDRAIAQLEYGSGTRCLRFTSGEVECSFEPAPPATDFVEIAVSSTPAAYACGIRSDETMVCWGEPFPWCGQSLCGGAFECFDEQCLDCSEGCEPCGDDVCQGQTCIADECRTCVNAPCVACGDEICDGSEECVDGQCLYCGDSPCLSCGDTYCDVYQACVEDVCVPSCNDNGDCTDGEACIDGGCIGFGLPACEDFPAFVASALPVPMEVRGRPLAFADDDEAALLVAGPMGAWVVAGPELADATQIVAHDGDTPLRSAVGDFDGDGDVDIALANVGTASVTVFDNDGAWTPSATAALPTADDGVLVAADADGDGLADLFFGYDGGARDGGSSWHRNLGGGMGFVQEVDDSAAVVAVAVASADLDRDGLSDFAVGDVFRAKVLAPATGDLYFALQPYPFEPTAPSVAVAIGDFDGDGALGVALVQYGDGAVWIDTWAEPTEVNDDTHAVVSWRTPNPPQSFALAADLDADGDDELLVPSSGELRVWRGSGSLTTPLECIASIPTPIDVERLTAADFDGDGSLDLVVGGSDGSLYLLASG